MGKKKDTGLLANPIVKEDMRRKKEPQERVVLSLKR